MPPKLEDSVGRTTLGCYLSGAGEVAFAGGFIIGDVDGNGADFRIAISAVAMLASDFIL